MANCAQNPRGVDHIWIDGHDGEFQLCMYCGVRR